MLCGEAHTRPAVQQTADRRHSTVDLPFAQVSYLTLLDKFVSLCFLFMTAAAVENACVPTADGPEASEEGEGRRPVASFDSIAGIVWGSLWLLTCAWYICAVRRLHATRASALQAYTASSYTGALNLQATPRSHKKIAPVLHVQGVTA